MKKNGFVFIETIVAIVVLTTSLLLLYSSFSKILQSERTRVYYDNITYVYRAWNTKKYMSDLKLSDVLKNMSNTNYVINDLEKDSWITNQDEKSNYLGMINEFEINKIVAINEYHLIDVKKCSIDSDNNNCKKISNDMLKYIKSISYKDKPLNILVIEFNSNNSKKFYSWVGVYE